MNDTAINGGDAFQKRFNVSRETIERLQAYHDLLIKWQKIQNLVSPSTLPHIWQRHFADSAQLIDYIGDSKTLVDLGSGGGFPGMVLTILLQETEDFQVHLVEANSRKCSFLKDVARVTGVNVEIHNCRIEVFAIESTITNIDLVTARALKPLVELLELGLFAFEKGARGVFLKGKTAQDEITEAETKFAFKTNIHSSQTDDQGRIVEIYDVKPKT